VTIYDDILHHYERMVEGDVLPEWRMWTNGLQFELLEATVRGCKGNYVKASRKLGVKRTTIIERLRSLRTKKGLSVWLSENGFFDREPLRKAGTMARDSCCCCPQDEQ